MQYGSISEGLIANWLFSKKIDAANLTYSKYELQAL